MTTSAERDAIRAASRDFVAKETHIGDLRSLRESGIGIDRELWSKISELGWPGVIFPESCGGLGLSYAELGEILIQLGRTLAPTPFLSTVVLGGECIHLGGAKRQVEKYLPGIVRGNTLLSLACQEGPDFDPYCIELSAKKAGASYVLNGTKSFVLDAHAADHLVVVARSFGTACDSSGVSLFVVDTNAPGLEVRPSVLLDSRVAANVGFADVEVDAESLIGDEGKGREILEHVITRGTAALAAEMLGGILECFERTVDHLKERKQFGVPIGSFQALQHRAAHWQCEVELTRAIVEKALEAVAQEDFEAARKLASAAKARASDVFMHSASETIQLFGGVAMTDAHDAGFFLKRARVCEQTLGDGPYHRELFYRSFIGSGAQGTRYGIGDHIGD